MSASAQAPPARSERGVPVWYRVVYVACIVVLSVETMLRASAVSDHRFWLAGIEVLTALLLLARRTQRVGLIGLLMVCAVVALHDITIGQIPADLVVFAASAILIVSLDAGRSRAN